MNKHPKRERQGDLRQISTSNKRDYEIHGRNAHDWKQYSVHPGRVTLKVRSRRLFKLIYFLKLIGTFIFPKKTHDVYYFLLYF